MNKKELLSTYRARVLELEELRTQLRRVGTDGRPGGIKTMQFDVTSSTNDPGAAAMQLADGLEEFAARKEEELRALQAQMDQLLHDIKDFRTYLVIHHYYVLAKTDAQVSRAMSISRARVNQLRLEFLESA